MKTENQEITFESYLKKATNKKLQKRKSDRYAYNEAIGEDMINAKAAFAFIRKSGGDIIKKVRSYLMGWKDDLLNFAKSLKKSTGNILSKVKEFFISLLKKIPMPKMKEDGLIAKGIKKIKGAFGFNSNYEYEKENEEFYNENFNLPFSKPNPGNVIKIVYRVKDHKININSITGEVVIEGKNPEAIWEEIFPGRGIKSSYKWKKNEWSVIRKYIEGGGSEIAKGEIKGKTDSKDSMDSVDSKDSMDSVDSKDSMDSVDSKDSEIDSDISPEMIKDVEKAEKDIIKSDDSESSMTPFYKKQVFWFAVAIFVLFALGAWAFIYLNDRIDSAERWSSILIGLGNLQQAGINQAVTIKQNALQNALQKTIADNKLLSDQIEAVNYKDTVNAITPDGFLTNIFTGKNDKISKGQEAVANAVAEFKKSGMIDGQRLTKGVDVTSILKNVYEKAANK